jgi:predicted DNA-binding WGR domain protein
MTRNEFLSTKIPVIAYLTWIGRNSTKYYEMIFGDYKSKRVVLSWDGYGEEVNIFYNDTALHPNDQYKELIRTKDKKEYSDFLKKLESYL